MDRIDADEGGASSGGIAGSSIRWRSVVRDLALVTAWFLLVTFTFDILRWPTWAYYLVVFGGIVGFSLVADPWTRTGS